jgi:hypothetical protein
MSYGQEIKSYAFPSVIVGALGSLVGPVYTNHSINGEILKVTAQTSVAGGSIAFAVSGTNEAIGYIGNVSGTSPVVQYPREKPSSSAGITLTYASGGVVTIPVNGPLYYAGSGFTSGTSTTLQNVVIYYK